MANRFWLPVFGLHPFEVLHGGVFAPQGSSAPMALGARDWTVARTGVGVFVITYAHAFDNVLGFRATVQQKTPSGGYPPCLVASVGPVSLPNRTIEIDIVDPTTGALTDIASDSNNLVYFHMRLASGGPSDIRTK